MTPIDLYNKRATRFFLSIAKDRCSRNKCSIFVVTHVLPDKPALLSALNSHYHIAGVIPKPKSIDYRTLSIIRDTFKLPLFTYSRDHLGDSNVIDSLVSTIPADNPLIILDIGGYFAKSSSHIRARMGSKFYGVVEDTENGLQKYLSVERSYPVISVARSPLKEPEDYLVGRSIVFSADAVARQNNELLINKNVLVIGYGKIGKSIADGIASRNIGVSVYDRDPIKMAQAKSHGYRVGPRDVKISEADMIFGATGNKSLGADDLRVMKDGTFVVSVTSRDDEFGDFGSSGFNAYPTDDNITIFTARRGGKKIYLMSDGNAVNFLHNAVVGPYIYLVQSEIFLATTLLLAGSKNPGHIEEVGNEDRRFLANRWLEYFNG